MKDTATRPRDFISFLSSMFPSHLLFWTLYFNDHQDCEKEIAGNFRLIQSVLFILSTSTSMWYDQTRNRFYSVFHARTFIGMMTSTDGFYWEKAAQYRLSPKGISFDDGTIWKPQRMERPFVLTDEQGQPQLLFVACEKDDMAVIVALPLSAAKD